MNIKPQLNTLINKRFKTEEKGEFTVSNYHCNNGKVVIFTDGPTIDLLEKNTPAWLESLQESSTPARPVQSLPAFGSDVPFTDIAALMKNEIEAIKSGKEIDHKKIKSITSLVNTTMNVAKTQIEILKINRQ